MPMNDRSKATQRIAFLGIAANALLLCGKLIVGYAARSQAMIADGFNSAGDVFSSFMTLLGSKVGERPSDEDHPFGHGKAEYIFAFVISLSLILVAVTTFGGALTTLIQGEEFSFSIPLIGVAGATILIKLGLFLFADRFAKRYNSLLIRANAEDHRNDMFLTSGTVIGILCGLAGWMWVDGVIGMLISIWIAFTGFKILKSAYMVLLDTGVKRDFVNHLREDILNVQGVDHIDSILTSPVGAKHVVIVKASVDGNLTVHQSHAIAKQIELDILRDHENVADVIVHINPV